MDSQRQAQDGRGGAGLSFGMRTALVLCAVVAVLFAVPAWLAHGVLFELTERNALTVQQGRVSQAANVVELAMDRARRDVQVVAGTPPARELSRLSAAGQADSDGEQAQQWRRRMEVILIALLDASEGDYSQARVLGPDGRELVRVDRDGGRAMSAPLDDLQDKSSRYYFRQGRVHEVGVPWVSEFDLNREYGALERPLRSTVRVGMTLEEDGQRALIVLNVDGRRLLEPVLTADAERFVANQEGTFLLHPDPLRQLGFERGHTYNTSDEVPADVERSFAHASGASIHEPSRAVYAHARVYFDPDDESRYWTVFERLPYDRAFPQLQSSAQTLLAGTIASAVLALVIAFLFARWWVVRPILHLAETTRRWAEGDRAPRLRLPARRDEVREVFAAVNQFADEEDRHREELESQMEKQKAALDTLVTNLPDATLTIDPKGHIVSFNPAAERMFGRQGADMLGKNLSVLMPAPHREMHDSYLARYMETGEARILGKPRELEAVRADGEVFPIRLHVARYGILGEVYFVGIVRDISERKAVEREIADQNAALLRTAHADRVVAGVGNAFLERRGVAGTLSEILELLEHELSFRPLAAYVFDPWRGTLWRAAARAISVIGPGEIELGEGLVGQAAADGRTTVVHAPERDVGEFQLNLGVGVEPAASVAAVPLFYKDTMHGVLVCASPVPIGPEEERVLERIAYAVSVGLADEESRRRADELMEQLSVRDREISRRNQELTRANRMKTEFLANMSHELRTPLNAIIGFSEVILDGMAGDVTDKQRDFATEILAAGQHLLALINDILDLSKIEAGKMELTLEPVRVMELVENALAIVREQAAEGDVKLIQDLEHAPERFIADGRKLRQVLYNLLSNAVKFTPEGGEVRVEVRGGVAEDDPLCLRVTDTGEGIAPDQLDRVRQPFEQADGSTTRSHEGTGLGLSLVDRLVGLHGGTVRIDSDLGRGTSVTIQLPWRETAAQRAAEPREEEPPRPPAPPPPTAPSASRDVGDRLSSDADEEASPESPAAGARVPRVLLVGAPGPDRENVRSLLLDEGYELREVDTAREARPVMEAGEIDVVVLDVDPSNGTELELLEAMAAVRAGPRPAIVLSVSADGSTGAVGLGVDAIVNKPVRRPALRSALHRCGLRADPPQSRARVLIIDDDPTAVRLLSEVVRDAGHRPESAFGGREGLAAVRRHRPDVVLLDLLMPDPDGFEVLAALKQSSASRDIPVVVVTSKTLSVEERERLAASAHAVVAKYEVRTVLAREVGAVLARRRKGKQ